jgi:PAS domain S-box-containing protein
MDKGKIPASIAREKTAFMFDMVPALIIIHELTGRIVWANAYACRLHGFCRKDFLGRNIQEFIVGVNKQRIKKNLELFSRKKTSFEATHRRKDGTVFSLLVNIWPVTFSDQRLLVSVASDITERKRMLDDLGYSESRFRDMCDFLPQVIYEADLNGKLVYINKRAFEVFGFSEDDFKAGLSIFQVLAPEDVPRAKTAICSILAGITGEGHEYAAVRKDGKRFPILVSTAPLVRSGAILGIRGVLMDITDRKLAEVQKMEFDRHIQLTEKIDSLGVLAGGIAHDFNNLLGGLYGYLEMALDQCKPDDKIAAYLRKAEITFERAKDLTLQLLTFSKGGAPIRSTGDITALLRENTRFALSGSNVKCVFRISRDLRLCDFDKNQIGQVIDNLVINACQAMPGGGTLTVSAKNVNIQGNGSGQGSGQAFIKISFTDTGPGIPAEIQQKIFDPFFTTKSKGTGLGLTTVYSIIKKHDGEITVDSVPGKGATFHILLPASEKKVVVNKVVPNAEHRGAGRALVMDDESAMREILGAMLSSMGYAVDFATDGWEALDLVSQAKRKHRSYTAVFMDLTVPGGMGGRETVVQLRELDPAAKAFVVSGYSQNPVMSDPVKFGFADRLQKPFRKSELSELLNKHLSAKRQ